MVATGSWWHLNLVGWTCGNSWSNISGMVSNTSHMVSMCFDAVPFSPFRLLSWAVLPLSSLRCLSPSGFHPFCFPTCQFNASFTGAPMQAVLYHLFVCWSRFDVPVTHLHGTTGSVGLQLKGYALCSYWPTCKSLSVPFFFTYQSNRETKHTDKHTGQRSVAVIRRWH